jgi:hypothetical protein
MGGEADCGFGRVHGGLLGTEVAAIHQDVDLALGPLYLDAVLLHDLADELVVGGDVGEVLLRELAPF